MRRKLPKTVTIIYNAPSKRSPYPDAPITDIDTETTPREIEQVLKKAGVRVTLMPIRTLKDLRKIRRLRTNLVVNCVEDDISTTAQSSHLAVKALQEAGLPYTGGTAGNILLTTNKAATKQFLLTHGIPTPPFAVVETPEYLDITYHLRSLFPLIVKPVAADGSEGISPRSVVINERELRRQVTAVVDTFRQPALVEQYINTREVNVAIIEKHGRPVVLPPSEIKFIRGYGYRYKIVDFAAKWRPRTRQYRFTRGICPAPLSAPLDQKLKNISLGIWKLLNLQSYARVDFRIDENGNPFVLEVNVNPDISNSPDTGFPRAAAVAGMTWDKTILTIVSTAWARYR